MCYSEETQKKLVRTIEDNFKVKMLLDRGFCVKVWESFTNIEWYHETYGVYLFSFREIGAVISDILDKGTYMDWYCCGQPGCVDKDIEEQLNTLGWTKV